jgi:glycerophosphoryl diester phosphodiesterase
MIRVAERAIRSTLAALLIGLLGVPVAMVLQQHSRAAAAAAVAEATASRSPLPRHQKVLIIAHRGYSAIAPENTVPAFAAAAQAHADLVEFDVQRTSDHHLIVVHDHTFARTTNIASVFPSRVHDPVGSFTLAQVRQLDAGSWKGAQYVGTRVPTLNEVLATIRPTSTNLLLELKNPALYPGYEHQVAAALAAYGFIRSGRVYVHSFDRAALQSFHGDAPTVPLGLLTRKPLRPEGVDSWINTVEPTAAAVTDPAIDQVNAARLQVFAWPANQAQGTSVQIERMVKDGVTGIITNDPRLLRTLVDAARASGAIAG